MNEPKHAPEGVYYYDALLKEYILDPTPEWHEHQPEEKTDVGYGKIT